VRTFATTVRGKGIGPMSAETEGRVEASQEVEEEGTRGLDLTREESTEVEADPQSEGIEIETTG